jgi:hypothetical protein
MCARYWCRSVPAWSLACARSKRPRGTAATGLPGWTVKDVATHLLDDDFGRLSRDRDGETTGMIVVDTYAASSTLSTPGTSDGSTRPVG